MNIALQTICNQKSIQFYLVLSVSDAYPKVSDTLYPQLVSYHLKK